MLRLLKHDTDETLYVIYYKFNMNIISISLQIKISRDLMEINIQQLFSKYYISNFFKNMYKGLLIIVSF